jgi:hypothetical protein
MYTLPHTQTERHTRARTTGGKVAVGSAGDDGEHDGQRGDADADRGNLPESREGGVAGGVGLHCVPVLPIKVDWVEAACVAVGVLAQIGAHVRRHVKIAVGPTVRIIAVHHLLVGLHGGAGAHSGPRSGSSSCARSCERAAIEPSE